MQLKKIKEIHPITHYAWQVSIEASKKNRAPAALNVPDYDNFA